VSPIYPVRNVTYPSGPYTTLTLPRVRGWEGWGCTSWGIHGKNLYLIDALRRRMEYPELKREVRAQYERFGPNVVLIEDKASGTQLIQELIAEGLYAVTRYRPQTDKVMRMHAQTAMIENGFVHVPDTAPWLAPYLHELTISSRTASTTTRSTRPRSCSTGTSMAAAPAPTQGSSNFTGSWPKRRATSRPGARLGCVCAFLLASAIGTCSCSTSPPTAPSRCRRARPSRSCGPAG